MLPPFKKVVVDRKEEAKMRRRMLRRYPVEYIEAMWGEFRGDTLYIVAFVKMTHKGTLRRCHFDDQEFDFHEEDAEEVGMYFLGSIHSHPDCEEAYFSEGDLLDAQNHQEIMMGICAITVVKKAKKTRRKTKVEYWPIPRPLQQKHT